MALRALVTIRQSSFFCHVSMKADQPFKNSLLRTILEDFKLAFCHGSPGHHAKTLMETKHRIIRTKMSYLRPHDTATVISFLLNR